MLQCNSFPSRCFRTTARSVCQLMHIPVTTISSTSCRVAPTIRSACSFALLISSWGAFSLPWALLDRSFGALLTYPVEKCKSAVKKTCLSRQFFQRRLLDVYLHVHMFTCGLCRQGFHLNCRLFAPHNQSTTRSELLQSQIHRPGYRRKHSCSRGRTWPATEIIRLAASQAISRRVCARVLSLPGSKEARCSSPRQHCF